MSYILFFLLIFFTVLIDYYWFDTDQKRWGWVKNWSEQNKILFFSGFIIVSGLIYFGMSIKFL